MKKYLQNQIATSPLTLLAAAIVTIIVWLAAGLLNHPWWIQLACMAVSTYLLVEMSNNNALLRVRSRMVTSVFLLFSACLSPYIGNLSGAIITLCFIASILMLFQTYQNQEATGLTFYSSLFIGIASLFWAQSILFVPLFWILSLTQLQSLSLRTWAASLLGFLVPYWFALPWMIYNENFGHFIENFSQIFTFDHSFSYSLLSIGAKATLLLILILFALSFLHFRSHSFEDRIRIRQLYGFFAVITVAAIAFLLVQPQFFDPLMRIIIIFVSPFVAHFFTLTSSKVTNLIFIIGCILLTAVIGINLYESISADSIETTTTSWSGLLTF